MKVSYDKPTKPGNYWCCPFDEAWQVVSVDWLSVYEAGSFTKTMLTYRKHGNCEYFPIGKLEMWGPSVECPEELLP